MTERQKLTLNRSRKASPEEQTSSTPVYGKKVWVNATPKKQAKKPKPQKVAKPQPKKVEKPKQEVKVKIPKPPTPPKKRLPLDEAISQKTTFWPYLFPDSALRPMKIGIVMVNKFCRRSKRHFLVHDIFDVALNNQSLNGVDNNCKTEYNFQLHRQQIDDS